MAVGMAEIDLQGKHQLFQMTHQYYEELTKDYPILDVSLELKMMRQWLENHPSRRPIQMTRFISNWLARAKPRTGGSVPSAASQNQALVYQRNHPDKPHEPARDSIVRAELFKMKQALGMQV